VTLPGPWRVLTGVFDWSTERYAAHITRILERALLVATEREPVGPPVA
jgi:hypothetical protein